MVGNERETIREFLSPCENTRNASLSSVCQVIIDCGGQGTKVQQDQSRALEGQ